MAYVSFKKVTEMDEALEEMHGSVKHHPALPFPFPLSLSLPFPSPPFPFLPFPSPPLPSLPFPSLPLPSLCKAIHLA